MAHTAGHPQTVFAACLWRFRCGRRTLDGLDMVGYVSKWLVLAPFLHFRSDCWLCGLLNRGAIGLMDPLLFCQIVWSYVRIATCFSWMIWCLIHSHLAVGQNQTGPKIVMWTAGLLGSECGFIHSKGVCVWAIRIITVPQKSKQDPYRLFMVMSVSVLFIDHWPEMCSTGGSRLEQQWFSPANGRSAWGVPSIEPPTQYTSKHLFRRYLDPPNPLQTPSQKVLGGLGYAYDRSLVFLWLYSLIHVDDSTRCLFMNHSHSCWCLDVMVNRPT